MPEEKPLRTSSFYLHDLLEDLETPLTPKHRKEIALRLFEDTNIPEDVKELRRKYRQRSESIGRARKNLLEVVSTIHGLIIAFRIIGLKTKELEQTKLKLESIWAEFTESEDEAS